MAEDFDPALERTLLLADQAADYLRNNLDPLSLKDFNYRYPHRSALNLIMERYTSGENVADFFHQIFQEIAPYCGIAIKQNPQALPVIHLIFSSYWDKIDRFYSLDEVVEIIERGIYYHPDNLSLLAEVVNLYQQKGQEAKSLDDKLIAVGSALKYMKRIKELVGVEKINQDPTLSSGTLGAGR